jgi:hypothetical protein
MKKKFNNQFRLSPLKLISIILVSSVLAWVVYSASAATGSLSLSSSKSKVTQNEIFTVTITETTDTPISIVNAKLTYDPTKLEYKGADYTGSPFTTDGPESSTGTNYVIINRFLLSGNFPSGSNLVAKLQFKVIKSSGTANIEISKNDSKLISYDNPNDILSTTSGVSVSISTTPVNPPVSPPSPPLPPAANPAGPTHTVTPPPSTPSTPAAPSTSRPTTPTAPTPSASPSSNPITNYFRPATNPTSTQFKAGDSKLSKQPSLMQKILIWVKLLAPIVVVGTIIIGIVWFVIKKASMHAFGFGEAVTGLPHVGPVKTPISNTPANNSINQPVGPIKPSPSSGTNVKPSSYTDPNDHTPRTFSGV